MGFRRCSIHDITYDGECGLCKDELIREEQADEQIRVTRELVALQRETLEQQKRAQAQQRGLSGNPEFRKMQRATEVFVDRQLLSQLLEMKDAGASNQELLDLFESEDFQRQRDGFVKEMVAKILDGA
jgi:hypothetical protein